MTKVFDDLLVTIKVAQENGRKDIGIGEDEIYPLAFFLKEETDGTVFGDASFNYTHSNIRSPEISRKLSFLSHDDNVKVLHETVDDVSYSDEYFRINTEKIGVRDLVSEREDDIGEALEEVESAISQMEDNRFEFIQSQDRKMRNQARSRPG